MQASLLIGIQLVVYECHSTNMFRTLEWVGSYERGKLKYCLPSGTTHILRKTLHIVSNVWGTLSLEPFNFEGFKHQHFNLFIYLGMFLHQEEECVFNAYFHDIFVEPAGLGGIE